MHARASRVSVTVILNRLLDVEGLENGSYVTTGLLNCWECLLFWLSCTSVSITMQTRRTRNYCQRLCNIGNRLDLIKRNNCFRAILFVTELEPMPLPAKDTKPLALPDTLRDLALLRAYDIDLAGLVPKDKTNPDLNLDSAQNITTDPAVETSLKASYEFVQTARAAIRIHVRGDVGVHGAKVDEARDKLETLLEELKDAEVSA